MKQEMMGRQWHQLDHMQIICISLQTDNHASTSSLNFFTVWAVFLMPNQQCQSTEGTGMTLTLSRKQQKYSNKLPLQQKLK